MGLNVAMLASDKAKADNHFYKFFNSYKGRNVLPGQRVEVYRNLKYKDQIVYSIRDVKYGRVLGHASHLLLNNCYFVVRESSRQRVIREKRKNICAWIEGSFGIIHAGDDAIFTDDAVKVRFNPYKNSKFVFGEYEKEYSMLTANLVYINENGVFASGLGALGD